MIISALLLAMMLLGTTTASVFAAEIRHLVHFQPATSLNQQAQTLRKSGVKMSTDAISTNTIPDTAIVLITIPDSIIESAVASLSGDSHVKMVERDMPAQADYIPTDSLFSSQWSLARIGAPAAWDITTGSPDTIVAVIDTGIDHDHPEFAGRIVPGYDFVDLDSDPEDIDGHGTLVSGLIGAADNGVGMVGVAPGVSIMPVRAMNTASSGFMGDVAMGVVWAADNGATIINLSVSSEDRSFALESAIFVARSKGAAVFCSAGNSGFAELHYPARFGLCTSVSATDQDDNLYQFSSYGVGLEMAAPGVGLISTSKDGNTGTISGTSSSVPLVSGVAALMNDLGAPALEIEQLLLDNAEDIGPTGQDSFYGHGLLNAPGAVADANEQYGESEADTTAPVIVSMTVGDVQRKVIGTKTIYRKMRIKRKGKVIVKTRQIRKPVYRNIRILTVVAEDNGGLATLDVSVTKNNGGNERTMFTELRDVSADGTNTVQQYELQCPLGGANTVNATVVDTSSNSHEDSISARLDCGK